MAFLRFSRDKRGYEQFAIVEPMTNRRGATRPRILYAFRTPPDVKVGREPFDEGARRALEAQYPGVNFDWRKIVETPIPSADAERWRERRRAEKAARQAAAADAAAESPEQGDGPEPPELPQASPSPTEPAIGAAEPAVDAVAVAPPDGAGANPRRRRRRRRGRRGASAALPGTPPSGADVTNSDPTTQETSAAPGAADTEDDAPESAGDV